MFEFASHPGHQMISDGYHRKEYPLGNLAKGGKRNFVERLQMVSSIKSVPSISRSWRGGSERPAKFPFRKERVTVKYVTVDDPSTLLISLWMDVAESFLIARTNGIDSRSIGGLNVQ
jgi:hypothetical protein